MLKPKACKYCEGTDHTSLMCFNKPRRPIKPKSDKTARLEQETRQLWFALNPPNERGLWYCYLRIAPDCWNKLTRTTIQLEHVQSKARYPERKYDVTNLMPACGPCNKMKGSRDLEDIPEYVAGNFKHNHLQLIEEGE